MTFKDCWNRKVPSEVLWSKPYPLQLRTWKPRAEGLPQGHTVSASCRQRAGGTGTHACSSEAQAGNLSVSLWDRVQVALLATEALPPTGVGAFLLPGTPAHPRIILH